MLCELGKLQTPDEKIRNWKKTLLNVLLCLYFIPRLHKGLQHFDKNWVNLLERLKPECSSLSSERAISFPLAKVRRDHPLLQQHDEVPLRGALILRLHRPHHPARSLCDACVILMILLYILRKGWSTSPYLRTQTHRSVRWSNFWGSRRIRRESCRSCCCNTRKQIHWPGEGFHLNTYIIMQTQI